jgi:glutathione synthase
LARVLFVVNDVAELGPTQTTWLLALEALRQGHEVVVAGLGDLSLENEGGLWANARRLGRSGRRSLESGSRLAFLTPARLALEEMDLCWLRTSPGRLGGFGSLVHSTVLELLSLAVRRGVKVRNDPETLSHAGTKIYLSHFAPDDHPRTLVTRSPEAIHAFLGKAEGACVMKPLVGTRGRDVYKLVRGDENLSQLIEAALRDGFALVQDYVPEAHEGDVRVICLGGRVLEVGGRVCAVRRRPAPGDFRSNVAVGGTPEPTEVSPAVRARAERIAPRLAADGLHLAGVDFVGDKVVEINVFSPGGLHEAQTYYGVDFVAEVVRVMLSDVEK